MPAWLRPGGDTGLSLAAGARRRKFRRRLRIPRELTGSELEIPIVSKRLQILPGRKTRMWTFGGTFPGPTIRSTAGVATNVDFTHRLPRKAGKLSVHLHGGHTPAADDGRPGGPAGGRTAFFCDFDPELSGSNGANLIAPGQTRAYSYPGVEDGGPERGAFQWYHDHRCGRSARNIWRGLAGMWIVDEPDVEGPLNLPTGARDIPLMVTDRAFNGRNQLADPFDRPDKVPFDQVTGNRILVNGALTPHAKVPALRHRLRLVNASSFRSYNLYFEGGLEMLQIATESGLMPAALKRRKILLGPGERVEVVVDFAKLRGRRVRLRSGRREGARKLGSKPFVGDLMQFRVGSGAPVDATSPLAHSQPLRDLPDWVDDAPAAHSHTWRIEVGKGFNPRWLINGKTFDPDYADVTAELGEVVTWRLKNVTAVAHLMHLHHTDWYMLRRNGETPPAHERCLKETFFLDPGDDIVVAGKISDYTGKYVVHCHMLDHEDHGLMSQFEVVEP